MEQKLVQLQAKLEADQSFGAKLFSQETPEAVQSFLKVEGLDFSLEEIDAVRTALVKVLEKGDGELTDADLEDVAGGFVLTTGMIATTAAVIGGTASAGTFSHNVTRGRW
ncbi:MAG: Nif11-like leader peptide family natural product precursor [Syntrophomonadaceae bacterium]|nr:Nif11-like leader peptide family natural product precursor [Syntrophomonadaceae bacterium]